MAENYYQRKGQEPSLLICKAGQGASTFPARRLTL
jgi:hypothetical protein